VASPLWTLQAPVVQRALTALGVQARIALQVQSFLGLGPIVAQTDLVATRPNNRKQTAIPS